MSTGRPRATKRIARITGVFTVTFAVLAAFAGPHRVNDPDVFWLARAGRDLVASGAVPTRNGYAFTDAISPWMLHESLFALGFFAGMRSMGPGFASLVGIVSAGVTVSLALCATVRGCRRFERAALGGLLLLLVAPTLFEPRPAFVSVAFVVAMVALALSPGWSSGRALGCIGVELVWASAHGSFPLGLVLVALSVFEEGRSRRERALWAATTAAATLATLCNPYGIHLYALVLRYLVGVDETARLFHENVADFLPFFHALRTPFIHPAQIVALLATFIVAILSAVRRERIARVALVLALVSMTLYQARHLTLTAVLCVLLLVPDHAREARPRVARALVRRALFVATLAVAPGFFVGFALWGRAMLKRGPDEWISPSLGGAALTRLVRSLPRGARVYAPFQPSGLLLWLGAEQGLEVFFDPRNDCYSPRVARMAFALEAPDVSPRAVRDDLAWARTEYAVVPIDGAVFRALTPSWDVKQTDEAWALLGR